MRYLGDVAALARKDLLLELRAKETLPAMLLFVLSALTILHFAVPVGTERVATLGLLWIALVFTALLGLTRAFVPEREQGTMDALVLAPCDRSAIWLAKSIAVFAFLAVAEIVALPAFSLFFSAIDARTVAAVALANVGICAVGTLTGAMAVAGRARELILPLLFLPLAIPSSSAASGRAPAPGASTSRSSRSTTRSSCCSPGRPSSTWSQRPERAALSEPFSAPLSTMLP